MEHMEGILRTGLPVQPAVERSACRAGACANRAVRVCQAGQARGLLHLATATAALGAA